jgi:hypothetical protein
LPSLPPCKSELQTQYVRRETKTRNFNWEYIIPTWIVGSKPNQNFVWMWNKQSELSGSKMDLFLKKIFGRIANCNSDMVPSPSDVLLLSYWCVLYARVGPKVSNIGMGSKIGPHRFHRKSRKSVKTGQKSVQIWISKSRTAKIGHNGKPVGNTDLLVGR